MQLKHMYLAGWLLAVAPLFTPKVSAQSAKSSFDEFRAGLKKDYSDFRKGILADYDKFLEGVWEDYKVLKGAERSTKPKPHQEPVFEPKKNPDITPISTPEPQKSPSNEEPTTPILKPSTPVMPEIDPGKRPIVDVTNDFKFDYFGIEVSGPKPQIELISVNRQQDFAVQWRRLSSSEEAKKLIRSLSETAREYSLNGYLTYELVASYVKSAYPSASVLAQHSLAHFILANMGYDVRIALSGGNRPLLLMAMDGMVYGRPFLELGGNKPTCYHVFELGEQDGKKLNIGSISTCNIPTNTDPGRPIDLLLSGLTIPEKPVEYVLEGGDMRVSGVTNGNIKNLLYRYPQMAMGEYAKSSVLPDVRASIVAQLKEQLAGMQPREAADKLLKFCQQITAYATDGANHGFEKPYFMEEMLVYPKSDCEDRAITYTYLLNKVLGLENHLLAYPGHESASVALDDNLPGDSYEYKGKKFYISDPTYIGAKTGMCMPDLKAIKPTIDFHYKP